MIHITRKTAGLTRFARSGGDNRHSHALKRDNAEVRHLLFVVIIVNEVNNVHRKDVSIKRNQWAEDEIRKIKRLNY